MRSHPFIHTRPFLYLDVKSKMINRCVLVNVRHWGGVLGSGGKAVRILGLDIVWRYMVSLTLQPPYPQGEHPLFNGCEVVWTPDPVWKWYRRQISAYAGNRSKEVYP
jgi:hypothetical protein